MNSRGYTMPSHAAHAFFREFAVHMLAYMHISYIHIYMHRREFKAIDGLVVNVALLGTAPSNDLLHMGLVG